MENTVFTIRKNQRLGPSTCRMVLAGSTAGLKVPGQFIDIALPGRFLRRPMSVSDLGEDSVTIVYRPVGAGTVELSRMEPGMRLDVLSGLGNGFDLSRAGPAPLLIGGGIGAAPLIWLARMLTARGPRESSGGGARRRPIVLLGFNSGSDIFGEEEFASFGCEVRIATMDGSRGAEGPVTCLLPETCSYYYACGPLPMLRAVWSSLDCPGELSLEERMGCGFGACMGCSIETARGPLRVCRDGPVFRKEDLLWQ